LLIEIELSKLESDLIREVELFLWLDTSLLNKSDGNYFYLSVDADLSQIKYLDEM